MGQGGWDDASPRRGGDEFISEVRIDQNEAAGCLSGLPFRDVFGSSCDTCLAPQISVELCGLSPIGKRMAS
jgi:hypothetical protein